MSSAAAPYGSLGPMAAYAQAFPAIPRSGTAATTVSQAPAASATTTVTFAVKAEAASGGGGGGASSLESQDSERESVSVSYTSATSRTLSVSLGPAAKLDLAALRKASLAAVAKLRALKVASATIVLPAAAGIPADVLASTMVQATTLGNYAFDRYLTLEDKKASLVAELHFQCSSPEQEEAARQAAVLAEGTIFARDLVNERADEMHPARLEAVALAVAAEAGARTHVLSGEALLPAGLHLLHAVGQSSRHAPRYVELLHAGDPANPSDLILLVGKGITFDSGGLNIKPTGGMEDMHMDMGGSAAVLGAFRALTRLGLKRNIAAVLAIAENAIDAHAFKPHSILRSHGGLTVEIKNTDAEGRLVLADALTYAQSRLRPHTIIDLATLTGACVVALGEYAAGMYTNNEALKAGLLAASEARAERLWPMPIFPEHREEIRAAACADLQSTGGGRAGGSCTAAAFLEFFIGLPAAEGAATPAWAHLDIAGPAMYSKARGHMNAGGTGFGVQAIAQYCLTAPAGALPATPKKAY